MAVDRFLLSVGSRDIAWLPTSKTTEKVAYLRKRKRQKIMARTVYSQFNFRPKQVKGKNLSQLPIRPEKTSYETLRNRDTMLRFMFTFF